MRAVAGQEVAQLGRREVGAVFSDQTVEPEPAAAVAAGAADFKVRQARGDLAEAHGAVGHDLLAGSSVWRPWPMEGGSSRMMMVAQRIAPATLAALS